MPVVKYIAVHSTPLSFLKYVTAEGKTANALVSGLNCSSDVGAAYEEMKFQFKAFASERFYKKSLSSETEFNGKEEIRMHHYIQSFAPGEVTAEEAHRIGLEWAKAVFGNNRSVIISTHIDREHIHNHFAAAAFDMDGKQWYGNKTTLKMCRSVSDKIAKAHGLSVIENPRYQPKQKYGEYKARLGGYSWKRKLCDDIDNAVLRSDSIEELLKQLESQGYGIRRGKYISVKVRRDRRPIRTYRLGDGYSLEHLEYRIRNKNTEMPLSEVLKYEGIQREWAMCIRQIQIEIFRKPENDRLRIATYREVLKSLDVLSFVNKHNIKNVEDFERKIFEADETVRSLSEEKKKILGKITEEERIVDEIPSYLKLKNKGELMARDIDELAEYRYLEHVEVNSLDDINEHNLKISELREQLAALDGKIQNAKNEKKAVSEYFQIYSDSMKTDYDLLLERAKAETENMENADQLEKEKQREREIPYPLSGGDVR